MVVNAKLCDDKANRGSYGFYPAMDAENPGLLITVERIGESWALVLNESQFKQTFPLPGDFDPSTYQQFRFRKRQGRLTLQWEATMLGEAETATTASHIGLYVDRAVAAFDLVRVTKI
jgi:hypothetical protein